MQYVTIAERIGIKKGEIKGREEGRLEGESALLIRQLNLKFKRVSPNYLEKINRVNAEELQIGESVF